MRVVFNITSITLDRRNTAQLENARAIEQERADQALEREWRRRVQTNVSRRLDQKVARFLSTGVSSEKALCGRAAPVRSPAAQALSAAAPAGLERGTVMTCPKCGAESGDSWLQCEGSCPMPMSPHFDPNAQQSQSNRPENEQ
jgi:hypothetical protein